MLQKLSYKYIFYKTVWNNLCLKAIRLWGLLADKTTFLSFSYIHLFYIGPIFQSA